MTQSKWIPVYSNGEEIQVGDTVYIDNLDKTFKITAINMYCGYQGNIALTLYNNSKSIYTNSNGRLDKYEPKPDTVEAVYEDAELAPTEYYAKYSDGTEVDGSNRTYCEYMAKHLLHRLERILTDNSTLIIDDSDNIKVELEPSDNSQVEVESFKEDNDIEVIDDSKDTPSTNVWDDIYRTFSLF
jgi:hypothetical protein